jgi:L-alanine-DL-glutamate epimerase-like enolase superfamily enzyme
VWQVVFKNFMTAGAVQVCQIDPTRLGGVGEAITCAMMARKLGLRVIPHVGDMGQLSQHLCLFVSVPLMFGNLCLLATFAFRRGAFFLTDFHTDRSTMSLWITLSSSSSTTPATKCAIQTAQFAPGSGSG